MKREGNNCRVAWNNKSAIFSHLMHYYIKRELTVIQKGTRPPYSLSYLQVHFHWLLFIYIIFSSYNKLNLMMECMYYNCSCSISHFKQMEWERINLPHDMPFFILLVSSCFEFLLPGGQMRKKKNSLMYIYIVYMEIVNNLFMVSMNF